MSNDEVAAPGRAAIEAALRGLRDTLAADGYELVWSMEQEDRIGIGVVAGSDACAECLVPPELMRSIVDDGLSATRYRVGSITIPPKS
jgi:hypothetical protein